MFGPARRPSKRLRTPLISAALCVAAMSAPAAALAADPTVTTDTPPFTGRFESTCVTPASAQGPRVEFEVSTLVSVKTTAAPKVGDEVSVQSYAAWQLGPDAVRALGTVPGLNVPDAILSVSPLVLGVSGTSSTSVQLGEGTNPNNGAIFRGVLDRAPTSPTTAGTFGPSFSAGRVQPGADAVTFTGAAFTLSAYIAHATSSVDGLANTPFTIRYDCTPTAPATIGSVQVTVGAPLPEVSALSSTTGSTAGGDKIIVVGDFPTAVQKVEFGGVPATFEKLDDRQIAVTVPPLPAGAEPTGVRVRVTTAAGESQEPVLFDYVDPADRTQVLGAFTSQCVSSSQDYRGEPFAVTTRVRVKTDASAGSDLRVVTSASLELAAPSVKSLFTLTGLRVENAALSAGPLSLGVSGTSQNSIALGATDGAAGPSLNQALGVPVTFGTPAKGFGPSTSAGLITPGTDGVTFTGAPFTFRSYVIARVDAPDDISVIPGFATYACTPTGDATIGSLKVGGGPAPVNTPVSFGLAGTATLKNLVTGSLPLTGSLAGDVDPAGAFSGTLSTIQGTAKLKVLGLLPVTAKVALVPTAPVTGTISNSSFAATAKVRIKIPSASIFGLQIAGGANCQATQPSTIPLKSSGAFTAAAGGTLSGTFSISNLSGCGFLTGIVSSLTAGSGNSVALALAPAPKS